MNKKGYFAGSIRGGTADASLYARLIAHINGRGHRVLTEHVGAGAALGADPEKVFACLRAIKGAVSLPVSLKTRPGPSPDRPLALELRRAAEEAGCSGFILHARFTSQMHGGDVTLDESAAETTFVVKLGGVSGN